jgi:hypothetical protein
MNATYVPNLSPKSSAITSKTTLFQDIASFQANLAPESSVLHSCIQPYLSDENWAQPFLLFAEMIVARADTLRFIMQEQTQKLLSSPRLGALLQWATQVTNRSEENLDDCAKRAEALSLAIHRGSQLAIGRARGHRRTQGVECANDLDAAARYAHAIASRLDANMTEGEESSTGRAFVDSVVATWYSGEFDPSILNLTKEETQILKDFLYANHLIVQCHALTATISTEAWCDIQRHMLQVDYED